MKKIILISLVIFLSNCAGYKPIFTSDQTNFYIEKIEISDDNKLVRKLIKSLKPFSVENGKQSITLKLNLNKQENVIMRDAKGDPASYEIKIKLNQIKDLEVLGPVDSPLLKIKKNYRTRLLIRFDNRFLMQKKISNVLNRLKISSKIKLTVDVDPINFA